MPLEIDVSKVNPRTRADGEGTIRRRKDSLYEGRLRVVIREGEPAKKRVSVFGRTQKEVREKLDKLKKKGVLIADKPPTPPPPPTLAEYLNRWWHNTDLKPTSLASRQLNVRRVSNIIGDVWLDQVTAGHIRQLDNALKKQGLSGSSRRQAFVLLRTALKAAAMDGDIPFSPFNRVDWRPKSELRPKRILSMAEKAKLFALNDEWTPLWQILLATGMRSGEALGLTWDKVDLDGGQLYIHQSIHWVKGGYRIGTPKTNASRRTLDLRPVVGGVFRKIKARQEAEAERLGKAWSNKEGFVFTWQLGQPTLQHNAHAALQRALAGTKAPPARVHDLRHTFASDQLLLGTPMAEVSRMLGHVSIAFTLKIYTHIVDAVQNKAAEAAANMLEEAMRMAELLVAGNLDGINTGLNNTEGVLQ